MDWNTILRGGWKLFAILVIPLFIISIILITHGTSKKTTSDGAQQQTNDHSRIWPNQRVPYVIDPLLIESALVIKNSMKYIQERTCVQFIEKQKTDKDWIKFIRNDGICYTAEFGRNFEKSKSGQEIELGIDCISTVSVQRALALVLGLFYEETRQDRDKYVRYNPLLPSCINRTLEKNDDELLSNSTHFLISTKHLDAALNLPFDYGSHMFVNKECFQPYRSSSIRLGSSDGHGNDESGVLSVLDLEKLNAIYQCSGCNSHRFVRIHKIVDSPHTFESFNPIQTGFDIDELPLYVCRAFHNGALVIGKMKMTHEYSSCWVGESGKEYDFGKGFDVLTNPNKQNFTWISSDNLSSMKNAIVGGRTNLRESLYIGRCTVAHSGQRSTVSGSYLPSTRITTVPFGLIAHVCKNSEVLNCFN